MRSLIAIVAFCSVLFLKEVQSIDVDLQCKPSGFQCINETTFIICTDIGNGILVPTPFLDSCPEGFLCDDNLEVPCVEETTTTSTTEATTTTSTTTLAPTTEKPGPFKCTESGKFPGEKCNKYITCTKVGFWFIKLEKTCLFGKWFNARTKRCVKPENSGCIPK